MNRVFLLLGSNLGNAELYVKDAIEEIHLQAGSVVQSSSKYSTQAWGKTEQPDFINQVIEIVTNLNPNDLLRCVLDIETKLGRTREEKWGARIIDIDILFINNEIIDTPQLQVPHPQIGNRRFTLIPLAEFVPDLIHPVYKKTIRQLLDECPDKLEVRKMD
jgi:2-amino-4-hydroxy-6-hydroxymethyldihydropteridine diphosphokinase